MENGVPFLRSLNPNLRLTMTVQDIRETLVRNYANLHLYRANEAETRLKLIDRIFFELLSWRHEDVQVEERTGDDGQSIYADYVFRTGRTAFVVEAKKVGQTFTEVPNLRRTNLRGKIMQGETGAAIKQVRNYAVTLSIPFAIVTNGSEWIIFPAHRTDQVPLAKSSAIIFSSLKSILGDSFSDFYDLLARDNVIDGSLENDLLGRIEDQFAQRRLNQFYTKQFHKVRRENLFGLIEDEITTAFTEDTILQDPNLLEKCYVKTPERSRFDKRINMHISKRQPATDIEPTRPLRERREDIVSGIVDAASKKSRPLAILILGAVGAGKTTFLHYSRNVSAAHKFEKHKGRPYPHWIYVDCRDLAPDESPTAFIFTKICQYIQDDLFMSDYRRCIRVAYKHEIESLLRGPMYLITDNEDEVNRRITELIMSDFEKVQPYVEKICLYVTRNTPIFLVVDNVDQFESEQAQSQIFSDTIAIASRLKMNLLLSLREATYVRHRSLPIFDAFDFDPIYIEPPLVSAVLSRRFFLARQLLSEKSANYVSEGGTRFVIEDLSVVINLVQASVLGTEVGHLIDVLATSDIRLALRMTREFLQYGYTATGRALGIYQRTGKYIMPQHEALRAIMLGNRSVYSEEYSVIGNPFDARLFQTKAQLLRLYILTGVVNIGSKGNVQSVSGTEIQNTLYNLGFGETVVERLLKDLCRLRFLRTWGQSEPSVSSGFLATRLGGYVVRELIGNMMFLENVMMDTFIPDDKVWRELRNDTDKIYSQRDTIAKLHIRKDRVRRFFMFMESMYQPLTEESLRRGLAADWCTNPIHDIQPHLEENLQRALRSARRHYGPKGV